MESQIFKFLRQLNIPVSKTYLKKKLLSQPTYPSLLSVGDVFEQLGLNYQIAKIEIERLKDVSYPYILHLKTNDILLIKNRKDLKKKEYKLNEWSGVIIKVGGTVKDLQNTEYLNRDNYIKNFAICILLIQFIFIASNFVSNFSILNLSLILSSVVGISIGYILLAKDLGITYKSIESWCQTKDQKGCDNILNSEGSKIFRLLTFSDLVFAYFSFQYLLLIFFPNVETLMSYIFTTSILSIPIIIYSVIYQGLIEKTWCKLCLIVDSILIFQILFLSITYSYSFKYDILTIGFYFLTYLMLFLILKTFLTKAKELNIELFKSSQIINFAQNFKFILTKQRNINTELGCPELILGNFKKAKIHLIAVINLYCNPCKKEYNEILQLLEIYPDKVSVSIRFLFSGKDFYKDPKTSEYILSYWLANIKGRADEDILTRNLLKDWFSIYDLEKFSEKYKVSKNVLKEGKILESKHFAWVSETDIPRTPALFINGFESPSGYGIRNIIPIIPELHELISIEGNTKTKFSSEEFLLKN